MKAARDEPLLPAEVRDLLACLEKAVRARRLHPVVDLSETDPGTGRSRRTVVKTTQPERFGIRVSDYFL